MPYDTYPTTYSAYSTDEIQYYILDEVARYTPPTLTSTAPTADQYLSNCNCPSCTDYFNAYVRDTGPEVSEWFNGPIAFHPSDDYVNVTPLKEEPVINPLPEPPTVHIYRRSAFNTSTPLFTVQSDTLVGADFSFQDLEDANFADKDLTGANFYGARLRGASFHNATLTGASFRDARLSDTYWLSARAADADFSYATMDYADVAGADFTDACFNNASFYSVYGTHRATFTGASLSGVSGITRCGECDYIEFRSTGNIRYCHDVDEYRCMTCGWEECEYCNDSYEDVSYHEGHCSERRHHALHEYDYSPYRFRPKGNYPAEPLMGVELEIGGNEFNLTDIVNNLDPAEEHLYCKHDGSVDGIEVVTHPMTLNWAKQNFDFKGLLSNLSQSGHSSDGYGIHVHVSRNAFRGVNPDGTMTKRQQPKHQMAWLMFMYRNADAITKIARRTSDNWASWRKPGKGELKRKAAQPDSSTGRYIAINCENDRTYEVRVFRSTLDFTEFMAAIELVDATVNYTRNLTTSQVLHNQAMSWGEFHKWCVQQGARYSSLLNQMTVQGTL